MCSFIFNIDLALPLLLVFLHTSVYVKDKKLKKERRINKMGDREGLLLLFSSRFNKGLKYCDWLTYLLTGYVVFAIHHTPVHLVSFFHYCPFLFTSNFFSNNFSCTTRYSKSKFAIRFPLLLYFLFTSVLTNLVKAEFDQFCVATKQLHFQIKISKRVSEFSRIGCNWRLVSQPYRIPTFSLVLIETC